MKLFCYPWSGGNSSLFFKYAELLGDKWTIIPLNPDFNNDTPFRELICCEFENILKQTENEEKIILFGHSMGAVIAFETAKMLADKRPSENIGLVVSGMLPPSIEFFNKLDTSLDREKAQNYSKQLGMDSLDKLPNIFLDAVINKMNTDNLLLQRYESCGKKTFSGYSAVIYSEQELSFGEPSDWAEVFKGDAEYIKVKGKHFYLTEDFKPVSDVLNRIRKKLNRDL